MAIQHYFEDGTVTTEWEPIELVQPRAIDSVNATRDAIIDGGFNFHLGGQVYRIQSRQSDRENVLGLAMAAQGAIAGGAQPGNLRWLTPDQDFGFITADNTIIPMDAYAVISLYQQALGFKAATTFYARALKDQILAATTDEQVSAIDLEFPQ